VETQYSIGTRGLDALMNEFGLAEAAKYERQLASRSP
jgi:hypothetical protein